MMILNETVVVILVLLREILLRSLMTREKCNAIVIVEEDAVPQT